MDPLHEQYQGISPYAFCANDPVNRVDKDGKKIYFASGVSQEFKDKFAATIKYMNTRGTSGDIAKLHASENTYYINEGDAAFDPTCNEIHWKPNQIVLTDNQTILFPATILAHEAKHAIQKDEMPLSVFNEKRKKDIDNPYDNILEQEVITTTEQIAARKHGDIENNDITRKNHSGRLINITNLPDKFLVEDFKEQIKEKFRLNLIGE